MNESPQGFTGVLKQETRQLHEEVEQGRFQKALSTGRLPQSAYVAYLQQMLFVHRTLENCMDEQTVADPVFQSILSPGQYREMNLLDDLKHFGESAVGIAPLGSTQALVDRIEQTARETPRALLGYHYVLEGSTNGGRFVAKAVRGAYGLTGSDGTSYLDPYGQEQIKRWIAFKASMDAIEFSEAETASLISTAKEMFRGIAEVGDALLQADSSRLVPGERLEVG